MAPSSNSQKLVNCFSTKSFLKTARNLMIGNWEKNMDQPTFSFPRGQVGDKDFDQTWPNEFFLCEVFFEGSNIFQDQKSHTLSETHSNSPGKLMVGRRSFPFGARPICRGKKVSFRECRFLSGMLRAWFWTRVPKNDPFGPRQLRKKNIKVIPKIVVPQNGWFVMENLIKMDDLGVTPIFGSTFIKVIPA